MFVLYDFATGRAIRTSATPMSISFQARTLGVRLLAVSARTRATRVMGATGVWEDSAWTMP